MRAEQGTAKGRVSVAAAYWRRGVGGLAGPIEVAPQPLALSDAARVLLCASVGAPEARNYQATGSKFPVCPEPVCIPLMASRNPSQPEPTPIPSEESAM
jgi:hypothetical protein